MKNKRQLKILNLIKNEVISTQEKLVQRLEEEGIKVTQATISRDIKNNRVKLNFKVVTDPASEVEVEDLISIRNRGRVEIAERRGFSNRGRIKLLLKRYT